jgi:hypothetical protein
VLAAYNKVQDTLIALGEVEPQFQEETARLSALVDEQKAGVEDLAKAGPGQAPGRAFQLMAGQTVLVDDVEDAETEAQGTGQSFWSRIKHWLGRAGKKLWAMISRLVKVKEWSLTGKVGTGVLGLAEASISVTFG